MTDNIQDRPAELRRKPKPAADETVDPVNYTGPTLNPSKSTERPQNGTNERANQAPEPARRRSRREVTFPFSTRLSQEVQDVLDKAVDREGLTVREAVEQAIRKTWG